MRFLQITNEFFIPIFSALGLIGNIVSTIVFSLIIIKNGQRDDMYKYLLLKSICEMLGCFFSVFSPMYYYNGYLKNTFIMVVWFIWFEQYIIFGSFMASTGFEIAATFNCAISIEKRMKWCENRLSFWIWFLFIFVRSFVIEMYPVFMFYVGESNYIDQFNKTIHRYHVMNNSFHSNYYVFNLIDSVSSHALYLLILLSLNCYILFKLIQIGRRKKRLTSNSSNVQNSSRAEKRKAIMIIILFLSFILSNLPYFMSSLFRNLFGSTLFWNEFVSYGGMFFYFSYSTSFFVYFTFNNFFRRLFFKIIRF
jgi:hypothetical protein